MTPEEYAQQQRAQAIANNDAWHLRNIEQHLRPYVAYCQQCNAIGAAKAIHDYAGVESSRLKARAALMEKYGIERLPNTHGEIVVALMKEAKIYIAENQKREK